jgi:hypothetical protein
LNTPWARVGPKILAGGDSGTTNRGRAYGLQCAFTTLMYGMPAICELVLASSRATYGEGAAECAVHGIVHPGPRRRTDLEQGIRDFTAWADEQPAAGGPSFEQTVAELREYGLLGQAGGSPVEPSPGRRLQLRPDR